MDPRLESKTYRLQQVSVCGQSQQIRAPSPSSAGLSALHGQWAAGLGASDWGGGG